MRLKKWARVVILILALSGIIYSLYNIIDWKKDNDKNKKAEETVNEFVKIDEEKEEYEVNFDELEKLNSDTIGYIYVPNSGISFVVVKAKDNNYYLKHNFEKEKSKGGWVFMDYTNTGEITDKNMVIYGHNRLDGSMFAPLKKTFSKEWISDSKNLDIIYVNRQGIYKYRVFSQYTIDAEDYYIKTAFNDDDEYKTFLKEMKKRSINKFDLNVDEVTSIITLSTCTNINDGRVVFQAYLVNEVATPYQE